MLGISDCVSRKNYIHGKYYSTCDSTLFKSESYNYLNLEIERIYVVSVSVILFYL